MRITVLGLWHLGSVTAACCAQHHRVTGLDFDATTVASLAKGKAPVFEPGLDELLAAGLASGALSFTSDPGAACGQSDVLWLCYDTPVDDDDESNVDFVFEKVRRALPHLPPGALVLVSSQLPVGSCGRLEAEFPEFHFACSPENLRLGKAIEVFSRAERYIVGMREDSKRALLEKLFSPFTPRIIFMRTESAEMVKHALNSFLAASVTFINEIARLCEHVGADAGEVSVGLKSDIRVGPKAYLGPGGPIAGGTLARDVVTLRNLGAAKGESLMLIPAIKQSNDAHRHWVFRRLQLHLGELSGKTVTVLGLTYKPGTDTLRRSSAVELCEALLNSGCAVCAFDPAVSRLPPELARVTPAISAAEAVRGADAVAVCTEWPEFREVDWPQAMAKMRGRIVIDPNRFLDKQLSGIPGVQHLSVGRQ